jgi:hypothetical protein
LSHQRANALGYELTGELILEADDGQSGFSVEQYENNAR